jgi:hypothetical protein
VRPSVFNGLLGGGRYSVLDCVGLAASFGPPQLAVPVGAMGRAMASATGAQRRMWIPRMNRAFSDSHTRRSCR